mmetsp:Transcript_2874/g.6468  ORF Transcript_2874/g.6468 Transcript_2874/m.6468 type:complete len:213 (+) Transcript_2874:131-769(+)
MPWHPMTRQHDFSATLFVSFYFSEGVLDGHVGVASPHLPHIRVPPRRRRAQAGVRVDLSAEVRGRRLSSLPQRHGPRAAAAELSLDALGVPVQIVRHRDVQDDAGGPRRLTEQHARGERLCDQQTPRHQLYHTEPHRAVALVPTLVHVQHVVAPDDEVPHEEQHTRRCHQRRREGEREAHHRHHAKHANLTSHPHASRAILDCPITGRHSAP